MPQFVANIIQQTKEKVLSKDLKGSAAVQINKDDDITPVQIEVLRGILRDHEALFSDKMGLAKEREQDWLRIPLRPDTEKETKPVRMYRLGPKEKEIVDKVFDEHRREGCLVDASGTPAGWPVFVVKSGQKWRPVVDLRGLNKYIVPDAYPLPKDAADAIAHMQAIMKIHTDRKREEFLLKPGDKAYLRLHKGYHLPGVPKAKIGQQRVGPFEVEAVVGGGNAYKLKLPKSWKIWPVISAVYLDKAQLGPDPYERIETPQPVVEEGELPDGDRWEVATIVGKCIYRRRIQYLVRWLNFSPEDDTWMNISKLNGCAELMEEYEKSTGNKEWLPPVEWAQGAS